MDGIRIILDIWYARILIIMINESEVVLKNVTHVAASLY